MDRNAQQKVILTPLEEYTWRIQDMYMMDMLSKDGDTQKRLKIGLRCILWELDIARKYKLTRSAMAMIEHLKPDHCINMYDSLPGTGIWLQLDDEEETTIYFSCSMHAMSSYAEHNDYAMLDKIKSSYTLKSGNAYWELEVQSKKIFRRYGYDEEDDRWNLPNEYQCPTGLCEMLSKPPIDISALPYWHMCETCKKTFEYWTAWLPTALMAINGDFAEIEEPQERKTYIERERRRTRKGKSFDSRVVPHTFEVVTFDISVKYAYQDQINDNDVNHPTWLDNAIADNTVMYVPKRIGETQRTFKAARYVNMRGKTITVKSFERRIPMTVKRLKQTIYKAIASKEK